MYKQNINIILILCIVYSLIPLFGILIYNVKKVKKAENYNHYIIHINILRIK